VVVSDVGVVVDVDVGDDVISTCSDPLDEREQEPGGWSRAP